MPTPSNMDSRRLAQQRQPQLPAPRGLGRIPATQAYLDKLETLVLSEEELKIHAYRVMVFNEGELMRLRRCIFCYRRLHKKTSPKSRDDKKGDKNQKISEGSKDRGETEETEMAPGQQQINVDTIAQQIEVVLAPSTGSAMPSKNPSSENSSSADMSPTKVVVTINTETEETTIHTEVMTEEEVRSGKREKQSTDQANKGNTQTNKEHNEKEKAKAKRCCRSHPGRVVNKRFTCCQKHVSEPGCIERGQHEPNAGDTLAQLEMDWQLHETPRYVHSARLAVAIDCEMGINKKGAQELIRVSAVDYFTGEVLLDALVFPTVPMKHLMTRYSGVNWNMLHVARATGGCLMGCEQARHHLWQFVGPDTIVMAHGGSSDLLALRWIHRRMVDTFQVEGRHVTPEAGRSLKNLVALRLHRNIQQGAGHDSIEDAMACRELTHWYVEHITDLKDGAVA